jgi:hypothetical protein
MNVDYIFFFGEAVPASSPVLGSLSDSRQPRVVIDGLLELPYRFRLLYAVLKGAAIGFQGLLDHKTPGFYNILHLFAKLFYFRGPEKKSFYK